MVKKWQNNKKMMKIYQKILMVKVVKKWKNGKKIAEWSKIEKKNFFPEFHNLPETLNILKTILNNNIKKNIVKIKIYLFKLFNVFIK